MAYLRVLAVFLVLECIPAKYVHPNDPLRGFDEPEKTPFDNFDTQISDQTPLAEIKRMFETLDQMPVHSRMSDEAHGPVAWYAPQQDEPLFDDAKCADVFSNCQRFVNNRQCWEDRFKSWMKSKCRESCKYCEVNCWDTKYGCCPDGKTAAEGPAKKGCGEKLCVDLRDCEKVKYQCDDASISAERKTWLKNNCAYTCRRCKAPNPKADCEARKPLYGCCWNGDEATGLNGQGCLPCEDLYVRACKLFGQCDSPFYKVRKFAEQRCPKTCGRCGASLCNDKQMTSKCEQWERQSLCTRSAGWKQYMEENCAKTCRFCGSSGNVGVRSLLGL